MASVDSLKQNAIGESSAKYWEKTVTDMNNVDETFANARDLGYTRLNYSRLTAIGTLSKKYDSVDIYKTQVVSNRGKLGISLRSGSKEEKVLDLSKYEQMLDDLKKQTDPEGWAKEQAEKLEKEQNQNLLELTAPDMKIEVWMTNKQGKQVLIGDSSAEKGTKTRDAMDQLLKGEYSATQGDYYVKISRGEDVAKNEEISYALQIQMGDSYKHDYVAMEAKSEDTKSGKESKIPLTSGADGLSAVNALQIQATRYQATAQMLQVGYLNMADIYNRNSKF